MHNRKYILSGILSYLIWGFFAIPLRALKEYPAGEILFFRILFSFVLLTMIISVFKRKELKEHVSRMRTLSSGHARRVIFLTLLGGVLLTINWLTFIHIVNAINVKTASFSYLICPVITATLGYVMLKEKLTTIQWAAVGLCTISCILIGLNSTLELGYSFLTALSYAIYLVSQRRNQGFDRMIMLGVQVTFAFLLLIFAFGYLVEEIPVAADFYSNITIIAAVFTVLPLFLNLYALNGVNSSTIGIIMYLNPLLNFILAISLFNETVTPLQLLGYSIICVALVIFNFNNFRKLQTAMRVQRI